MGRGKRKRTRAILYNLQEGICAICGDFMHIDTEDAQRDLENFATIDHIIRQRDGGGDELDNLQLVHKRCNQERD